MFGQTAVVSVHPYLRHPDLKPEWPVAFAHRGGHDVAPENTMASFEHAAGLGYRYLETDVHRTADGVLVAFHDPNLKRTCGIDVEIGEMTAAEVADARVTHPEGDHPIPLMSELFERFPAVHFNIDAKSDEAVEPLAELVSKVGAIDRVCLAAFKLSRLQRFRSLLGPGLITNMSPAEITALRLTGRLPGSAPRNAQVPIDAGPITVVTEKFLSNSAKRGVAVHVWTINERTEMERLLDLGVNGVMTDETTILRDVFAERGVWPS